MTLLITHIYLMRIIVWDGVINNKYYRIDVDNLGIKKGCVIAAQYQVLPRKADLNLLYSLTLELTVSLATVISSELSFISILSGDKRSK